LEESASESLRIAQLRYENGIDSFLQVQTAEVTLYNAQRLFLDTGLSSLMNRVELYKALGGGWNENTVLNATTETDAGGADSPSEAATGNNEEPAT
jgi:multidrug efflux system outer membrane protein